MSPAPSAAAVALAAAALLLGACGGGDGAEGGTPAAFDPNDPRSVVQEVHDRLAARDGDGVCELITPESRERELEGYSDLESGEGNRTCGEEVIIIQTESALRAMPATEVGEAEVDGDRATVEVTNEVDPEVSGTVVLERREGGWLVDATASD